MKAISEGFNRTPFPNTSNLPLWHKYHQIESWTLSLHGHLYETEAGFPWPNYAFRFQRFVLLEIPSSILTSQIAYRISKCRIADYIKLCLEAPHKRCPTVDKLLAFLASRIGKPSS